jgi:hypothetical protein
VQCRAPSSGVGDVVGCACDGTNPTAKAETEGRVGGAGHAQYAQYAEPAKHTRAGAGGAGAALYHAAQRGGLNQ